MQGLVAVGRVHLVAVLVAAAQIGGGADRVAERAVEAGGVLGGVGEDAGMDVPGLLQRPADGADAPVHHVRGRHHVGTGLGVGQGLADQHLHGFVVHDVAGVVDQTVLAVGGKGVQGHVGDHAEVRYRALQCAHGALGQTVRDCRPRVRPRTWLTSA